MMQLKKKIDVNDLKEGFIAKENYYSNDGLLLLTKDTILNNELLQQIKNNFYKFLYIKIENSQKKIDPLDQLDLDNFKSEKEQKHITLKIENPELKKIDFYNLPIEKIRKNDKIKKIEQIEKNIHPKTIKIGVPLSSLIKRKISYDSSKKHIERINYLYKDALNTTKDEITKIAYGKKNSLLTLYDIIRSFNSIMLEDNSAYAKLTSKRNTDETDFFYYHALNTALLSMNIAIECGYGEKQVYDIALAGLLSDIGMLLVPSNIITKPGKLTQNEFYEIKKHPISGYYIADKISRLPNIVKIAIYQIHEKLNGMGYPRGIKGNLINDITKLVQIADIYDALTSPRIHRKPMTPFNAIKELLAMSSENEISKLMVKTFVNKFSLFPIGSFVRLNNNKIGKVIETNRGNLSRPVLKIIFDENKKIYSNFEIVNLIHNPNLSIIESYPYDKFNKLDFLFAI